MGGVSTETHVWIDQTLKVEKISFVRLDSFFSLFQTTGSCKVFLKRGSINKGKPGKINLTWIWGMIGGEYRTVAVQA